MRLKPNQTFERLHRSVDSIQYRRSQILSPGIKLSPWELIGLALTQRYNRKFIELGKQTKTLRKQLASCSQLGNQPVLPKFYIKRTCLNFNYELHPNQKPSFHSIYKSYLCRKEGSNFTISHNKKIKHNQKNSIVEYYRNMRQTFINNKNQISQIDEEKQFKQTISGMYFIPNTSTLCNNVKYKSKHIYTKKNKKRINTNPELWISKKKRQIKQQDIKISQIKVNQLKQHKICESVPRKNYSCKTKKNINNIINIQRHSPKFYKDGKQKKMFRPWSAASKEESL